MIYMSFVNFQFKTDSIKLGLRKNNLILPLYSEHNAYKFVYNNLMRENILI